MGKNSYSYKKRKKKSQESYIYRKKLRSGKKYILKEHQIYYEKWSEESHYGQCGQSCPCCRWKIAQEIMGSCVICKKMIY